MSTSPSATSASATSPTVTTSAAVATTLRVDPPSGRLAMMTAYAIAATAIPVPFLPDRVITAVRGAVVQDVTARHGLSLTSDARAALAHPKSDERTRLSKAAETLLRQVLRRFPPLAAVSSASRGVEVFALGLLLDRYLDQVRPAGTVRMTAEEGRRVRGAIDRSLLRALSPSIRPPLTVLTDGVEDLRDEFTRWVDVVLLTTSGLPGYLERRLLAAFDEVVAESPELHDG